MLNQEGFASVVKQAVSGVRLSFSKLVDSESRAKLHHQESLLPE